MGGNSILHATGLTQCCTVRWGDSTDDTRWMGCFDGPECIASQWRLQGPLKWDTGLPHTHSQSTACLVSGIPLLTLPPEHECHAGRSEELPICGLVSVNSEYSFTSLTTLSPPSESLGLFQNCLLLALLSLVSLISTCRSHFPTLGREKNKKNPHNVPFL